MKKLILLAIFCFNPLFIEQNISNVYLKSFKKATQKNVWQENGCRANVLYAAVTHCRNTKKGLVCRPVKKKAVAQARRISRRHTAIQRKNLRVVKSSVKPVVKRRIAISISGGIRIIRANGVPRHYVGVFPNAGNPNIISAQNYIFRIPAKPLLTGRIILLSGAQSFGVGINGVPFDPGADEWYLGNRGGGWQYEPLSGAVTLGVDENHAHVQPTGAYHYHGVPEGLLKELNFSKEHHSPLIGWAADGFPIYGIYGYQDSKDKNSAIIEVASSYQLKKGKRPSGENSPGGNYDGTFLADYKFIKGSGTLDECNGRETVTPEFPEGTYAYFLTNQWPVIPRCFKGTPSDDFRKDPPQ